MALSTHPNHSNSSGALNWLHTLHHTEISTHTQSHLSTLAPQRYLHPSMEEPLPVAGGSLDSQNMLKPVVVFQFWVGYKYMS